jgi:hypothetical protein
MSNKRRAHDNVTMDDTASRVKDHNLRAINMGGALKKSYRSSQCVQDLVVQLFARGYFSPLFLHGDDECLFGGMIQSGFV